MRFDNKSKEWLEANERLFEIEDELETLCNRKDSWEQEDRDNYHRLMRERLECVKILFREIDE